MRPADRVRFRERMCGSVRPIEATSWTIAPRGPHAADGIPRIVDLVSAEPRRGRPDTVLDLDALEVDVVGTDRHDGFRADVLRGVVHGIAPGPLAVVAGYADLLARSDVAGEGPRRTMHYRLLVRGEHRSGAAASWWVVEGVKTVRGGVRDVVRATTTLATIVVRLHRDPTDGGTDGGLLLEGGATGTVVSAGTLRVRGLLRQGLSMRGDVLPFLAGFAARAVSTRPVGR